MSFGADLLKSFIFIFFAAYVGDFLYFTVGSASTFIVGKLSGYHFARFSLWGIQILRENGKIKVRSGKFTFNPNLNMFPPSERSDIKMVMIEVFPLFFGTIAAFCLLWSICNVKVGSYRLFLAFVLLALVVTLIRHTISVLKIVNYIYGSGPNAVFWRENERITELVNGGVRPKDIEFSIPEDGESFGEENNVKNVMRRHYDAIRYYHALELGRFDECSYYIKKMEKLLTDSWIPSQTWFYYEIIYYYTAIMKDLPKAESYFMKIDSILEKDMDINGRRVFAAYLFYSGKDKNRALQAAEDGLKVMDHFPEKGLAYMERDLILRMIMEIRGEARR